MEHMGRAESMRYMEERPQTTSKPHGSVFKACHCFSLGTCKLSSSSHPPGPALSSQSCMHLLEESSQIPSVLCPFFAHQLRVGSSHPCIKYFSSLNFKTSSSPSVGTLSPLHCKSLPCVFP